LIVARRLPGREQIVGKEKPAAHRQGQRHFRGRREDGESVVAGPTGEMDPCGIAIRYPPAPTELFAAVIPLRGEAD
jgi:hypothetical protein